MKNLSETVHPAIRGLITVSSIIIGFVLFIISMIVIGSIIYPLLDSPTLNDPSLPIPAALLLAFLFLILPPFAGIAISSITIIMSLHILELSLGKRITCLLDGENHAIGHFADKYAFSDQYVIAHAFNLIDRDRAVIQTRLRLSFSYQEIEAFHNLMRRQRRGYHTIEEYDIPYPVTSFIPAISRHTTRHLLKIMHLNQYVVFEYNLQRDHTGIAIPSTQQFVTRRDILNLQALLSSSDRPTISASIGNKQGITINANRLQHIAAHLPEESNIKTYVDLNQVG